MQPRPQTPRWLDQLDFRSLWAGALAAAAAYAVVLLLSLILLVLVLVGAALADGRLSQGLSSGYPALEAMNAWAAAGQLATQLVAMAHFGTLTTSVDGVVPLFGALSGVISANAVPVGILAISVISLYWAGHVAERRLPSRSRGQLLAQSLATGIAYALLMNVLAAALAIQIPSSSGFTGTAVTAAGVGSTVFSLILGSAVSMIARNRNAPGTSRLWLPGRLPQALTLPLLAMSTHVLVFVSVATLVVWIVLGVGNGWAGVFAAPLMGSNLAGFLFIAAHLGAIRVFAATSGGSGAGNMDRLVHSFDGGNSSGSNIALAVEVGALLLALFCTVLAGVLVLLRRGNAVNTRPVSWLGVPAAYLGLGLVLLPLLNVSARFDLGAVVRGNYSIAPVWWTPVVFLLWGLLVEVAARYLAPYLLPVVPVRLQKLALIGVSTGQSAEPPHTTDPQPYPGPQPYAGQGSRTEPESAETVRGPVSTGPASGVPGVREQSLAKPLSPAARKKVLLTLSVLGLATVLVVGGLVAVSVIKAGNGPDKVVASYLQALIDGDAEKALRISDPGIANDQRGLLSNAVYGAADKRIDGYTILSTESSGETATVKVRVSQDGRLSEVPFVLNKENPELLDDHWNLKSKGFNLIRLSTDVSLKAFSVNGVSVEAGSGYSGYGSAVELPAFPGEYTVGVPESEKYLSADEKRVVLGIDSVAGTGGAMRLEVRASDDLLAHVNREVAALTGKCAASAKLKVEGCPFYKYEFGETRKVKWSVPANPKVSLQPSVDGTWRINTENEGTANVSYEWNSSFSRNDPDWKAETDTMSFSIYGKVTLGPDAAKIELSRY